MLNIVIAVVRLSIHLPLLRTINCSGGSANLNLVHFGQIRWTGDAGKAPYQNGDEGEAE